MNVLVVGDYCQDIFVRGKAERLCPEAPCPVLNPVSTEYNDGMAGNVAANVKSLRPHCYLNVIFQPEDIRKTRYVDITSGYILLRVDENDKVKRAATLDNLKMQVEMGLNAGEKFDIVLISDYNKGFLTEDVIRDFTAHMQSRGAKVFLDTKKILGEWSKEVDFVKIDEKEYKLNKDFSADTFTCKNLIVTFGSQGSRWINGDVHVQSQKVEVMDVSGAGDTYFAAFAIRIGEGATIADAMAYANRAAAVAVSKHGVVAVKQDELEITC